MTTAPGIHPDVVSAKCQTAQRWANTGVPETLTGFTAISTDGAPGITAEVTGPDPAAALRAFIDRQCGPFIANRLDEYPDDLLPVLDVSVPGQIACSWRMGGVWVQLWHHDQPDTPTRRSPLVASLGGGE